MAAPPQAIWCDWIPLQSLLCVIITGYNCLPTTVTGAYNRSIQPSKPTSHTTVAHNRPSPMTGYCLQQWAAVAYDDNNNNNRPSPMTGYCVLQQPGPMV